MPPAMPAAHVTVLFGACDRHNLGDLLFPHIVAALLPERPLHFAGLASRDMRPYGGHAVEAISGLARELGSATVDLIHVGGELLTCPAWDAAVMLLDDERAEQALMHRGPDASSARAALARTVLGTTTPAPYVMPKSLFARPGHFIHNAVGGVALEESEPSLREATTDALRHADAVTVRDRRTQDHLARHGIRAGLAPDAGVLVAELFGDRIARHSRTGDAATLTRRFPGGYLAVQFSADFADDASLDLLAAQLDRLAQETGYGLAFFRAGAAPMHDRLALYHAVRGRMHHRSRTALAESLNIWDLCGVIAASRGFLGSSLHGRIVALAHGLPRITLAAAPAAPGKHLAFVETWEIGAMPGVVGLQDAADAMLAALAVPHRPSLDQVRHLADVCREGCASWLSLLA